MVLTSAVLRLNTNLAALISYSVAIMGASEHFYLHYVIEVSLNLLDISYAAKSIQKFSTLLIPFLMVVFILSLQIECNVYACSSQLHNIDFLFAFPLSRLSDTVARGQEISYS